MADKNDETRNASACALVSDAIEIVNKCENRAAVMSKALCDLALSLPPSKSDLEKERELVLFGSFSIGDEITRDLGEAIRILDRAFLKA